MGIFTRLQKLENRKDQKQTDLSRLRVLDDMLAEILIRPPRTDEELKKWAEKKPSGMSSELRMRIDELYAK